MKEELLHKYDSDNEGIDGGSACLIGMIFWGILIVTWIVEGC